MKKLHDILLIGTAFLLAVNVILTCLLFSKLTIECQCSAKKSLSCEAMPMKFAFDYPDCANKLLEAMNVTNVKVLSLNSTNAITRKTQEQSRNHSFG